MYTHTRLYCACTTILGAALLMYQKQEERKHPIKGRYKTQLCSAGFWDDKDDYSGDNTTTRAGLRLSLGRAMQLRSQCFESVLYMDAALSR